MSTKGFRAGAAAYQMRQPSAGNRVANDHELAFAKLAVVLWAPHTDGAVWFAKVDGPRQTHV